MNTPNPAVIRAVEALKTNAALALAVGVKPASVSHWKTGLRLVPPKYVRAIERATNGVVSRHELRPDVFGCGALANDGEGG